jgi:hypothetical protein
MGSCARLVNRILSEERLLDETLSPAIGIVLEQELAWPQSPHVRVMGHSEMLKSEFPRERLDQAAKLGGLLYLAHQSNKISDN